MLRVTPFLISSAQTRDIRTVQLTNHDQDTLTSGRDLLHTLRTCDRQLSHRTSSFGCFMNVSNKKQEQLSTNDWWSFLTFYMTFRRGRQRLESRCLCKLTTTNLIFLMNHELDIFDDESALVTIDKDLITCFHNHQHP